MEMSSNPNQRPPYQPDADDSYWSALFRQEDSLVSPPPTEREERDWTPLGNQLDGRFRWADGGRPQAEDPWQLAQGIFDNDESLKLTVTGFNKGGLLVHWKGVQGFVPASQLVNFPQFHVERERVRALQQWQDKTLSLKIIEVNRATNRLILSERAAQVKAEERENLLSYLKAGDQINGQVTNLTNFGVFVDLGGVEGLIHISELSWSRVLHPSDILEPGQEVNVTVLNIDRRNQRIALSLKRLKKDPWRTAEERYRPGQLVEGSVTNIVNYGAFVLLEEELEGLIHISELAEGSFLHPRNVVRSGMQVVARVLTVDSANKRLALSLRGVKQQSPML